MKNVMARYSKTVRVDLARYCREILAVIQKHRCRNRHKSALHRGRPTEVHTDMEPCSLNFNLCLEFEMEERDKL